jgi:putative transcriptional regulator
MELLGKTIVATDALNDTWFQQAEILITEHIEKGASGFIINKLFGRKLNDLEEFKHAAAIDLYNGGPVDAQHIYFIHKKPAFLQGTPVNASIFFGGDFNKAVELLSTGKLSGDEVKIFVGYCGWDAEELESEIEEGSWVVREANYPNSK